MLTLQGPLALNARHCMGFIVLLSLKRARFL